MGEEQKPTEDKIEWTRRETCISTGSLFLLYSLIMAGIVLYDLFWKEDLYGNFQKYRPFMNSTIMDNSTQLLVDQYFEGDRVKINLRLFVCMVTVCINIFYIIGCVKRDTCLIQTWVVYQVGSGALTLFILLGCSIRLGKGIGMIVCYLLYTVCKTAWFLFFTYQAVAFRREIMADNGSINMTGKVPKKPIINPV